LNNFSMAKSKAPQPRYRPQRWMTSALKNQINGGVMCGRFRLRKG